MSTKIGIIGCGAFGLSAALELQKNKNYKVSVYDRSSDILAGATYANHNRHHYGFHYPRSQQTIDQINEGKSVFEYYFKNALFFNFHNYYCISQKKTKTNNYNYEKFLIKNKLEFKKTKVNKNLFNQKTIKSVYRVNEGVYLHENLKKKYQQRLKNSRVKLFLNHELIKVKNKSELFFKYNNNTIKRFNFDIIVNASYSGYNDILNLFDVSTRQHEYNLQELSVISFPNNHKIGITVMDGNFPSLLPCGNKGLHLLAHVKESQLIKTSSKENTLIKNNFYKTNFENIIKKSINYIPLLKKCKYHNSYITSRIVLKNRSDTRKFDIVKHRANLFSIFGAKIITCEISAKRLKQMITNI